MAKRLKILVAEDDELQRMIISETLRFAGYEVFAFNDSAAALDALPGVKPDVVISDLQMPNLDGICFLYHIRRDSEMGMLPFILVSGMPAEYFVDTAMALGASCCLTKPWHAKDLIATIRGSVGELSREI